MASREELRRLAQQQNLKAYQQSKEAQEEASGGVIRLGGRDPQTGKDVIIHQNDSQEIAGVRTFNASLAHGALVRATRPHGSSIVAVDSRSTFIEEEVEEVVEIKKKKQIIYPFKILFSVVEDGVRKFYVGGDRVTPILIYSLNNVNFDYKAFIDSTGISLTKFVAGIYCNTPEVGVAIVSETGVDFVSTLTSKFGNFISREGHWKSYGVIYSNLIKPSFNLRKTSEVVTGDEIFFSLATDEVRRGNAYPFYDPLFPPKTQQRTQGLLRVDSSGTLPSSHTGNYSYVKNITQGNNGRASFATETLNVIESFSGIPQSYFSVNGSKTIFNGQYSYEKANTENHEYREVSAHLPWDATTTSNYQTNFNSNFTGQIAVSEGVYKDILDTETRTSIKNVSTKQYSPYGGRYYSSYDRVLESNETQNKEQKYYGLQYISNQKNLSVFSEYLYSYNYTYHEEGFLKYGWTGYNTGYYKDEDNIRIRNTVETTSARYYLYDRKNGSTSEINSVGGQIKYNFNLSSPLTVGTLVISVSSGHLLRADVGFVRELYYSDSQYAGRYFERRLTTYPNEVWQNFAGKKVIVSKYENNKILQGHGIIQNYTYYDELNPTHNYASDAPRRRVVTGITVDITSVIEVKGDLLLNQTQNAVFYTNSGSINEIRVDNTQAGITFIESKDSKSPIKGTLYFLEYWDQRFKNSDTKNYVVAYDIMKVAESSLLQVVRRDKVLEYPVKSIKSSNAEVHSVSFFPPN